MTRPQGWLALILSLAIAAGALLTTWNTPTDPLGQKLGLDLRGGSQLTLQVLPAGEIQRVQPEQLEAVREVLERRVNGLGVAESTLQTIGDDQLVLQLPGEQDPTQAAKVLGTTALLEFRAQRPGTEKEMQGLLPLKRQIETVLAARRPADQRPSDPQTPGKPPAPTLSDEQRAEALRGLGVTVPPGSGEIAQLEALAQEVNRRVIALYGPTLFTGKDLQTAGRQQQQNGNEWEVTLNFTREGGEKFARLTQSIAGTGRVLGIVLDGRSISEATVGPSFATAGITGGSASISGSFSAETARELEVQLRGGSLPLPVKIVEVRTIGPSLGAENVRTSLVAGLAGLALVGVFMVVVYRLAGVVAVVALALYALFNLALYALIPVTLTLPGIAGFILSVGMAVDANVLIFERVKEELRSGNTLIRSGLLLDFRWPRHRPDQLRGAVLPGYRPSSWIRGNAGDWPAPESVHRPHLHPHPAQAADELSRPPPPHLLPAGPASAGGPRRLRVT